MEERLPKEYIANIAKSSTYFALMNGPIKDLHKEGKINDEELRNVQTYMENHLAYLYTVLLEENNIKKFDLIVSTMNKFYVNDEIQVKLEDGGFENFYNGLFPAVNNITMK